MVAEEPELLTTWKERRNERRACLQGQKEGTQTRKSDRPLKYNEATKMRLFALIQGCTGGRSDGSRAQLLSATCDQDVPLQARRVNSTPATACAADEYAMDTLTDSVIGKVPRKQTSTRLVSKTFHIRSVPTVRRSSVLSARALWPSHVSYGVI